MKYNNRVFLLGGFMINDNYGDVIQAKFWVNYYKKKKVDFTFVCYPQGKNKCRKELRLRDGQILDTDEVVNSKLPKTGELWLHLYGGGYLNNLWAGDFIPIIIWANKNGAKIFATGVQVDKDFINKVKNIPIRFLSVRDEISKSLTAQNSIVIDDSFGYFCANAYRFDLLRAGTKLITKKKVLIQLSLNSYVYDGDSKKKLIEAYRNLIFGIRDKYKLVLCSSFPSDVPGILENQKLVAELNLGPITFEYVTTNEIDNRQIYGFKFIVVCSFHTYLLAINKYACPVYYVAFSKYYQQKAIGLINYGLLNESLLIESPEKLEKVLSMKHKIKSHSRLVIRTSQQKFKAVLNKVDKVLSLSN